MPDKVQVLSPALRVAVSPSPTLPSVNTPDTVTPQVEQFCAVIVTGATPALLPKVRLVKVQLVLAVVGPKFLDDETLCSKVPPVKLMTPAVPTAAPLTVTLLVPLRVPAVTVRSLVTTIASWGWNSPPEPLIIKL